ncbi:MAG: hypothetical protein IJT97_00835 [Bacteroidaceae bacterium]|nr:hypothetical protein [Bacteroidaceae bacterium]
MYSVIDFAASLIEEMLQLVTFAVRHRLPLPLAELPQRIEVWTSFALWKDYMGSTELAANLFRRALDLIYSIFCLNQKVQGHL